MLETKRVDLSQLGGLDKHPEVKNGAVTPEEFHRELQAAIIALQKSNAPRSLRYLII